MTLKIPALALAAAAIAALPAIAAEPESGSVSTASPKVTWTGTAPGYAVFPTNLLLDAAGEGPLCPPEACDSFALQVADKGDLTVFAENASQDNFIEIHVIKPDGETLLVQSAEDQPAMTKIKNAPAGDYTIEVMTNKTVIADATYNAYAQLGAAPVPATPATAPPTTEPQPQPAQPQQPAALSLKTRKASLRKSGRRLKIKVASSRPVTAVKAVLKRGRKTVARGKLARLDGQGTLSLKIKRLRPGTYNLAITARDGDATVGLATKLKLTR